MKESIFLIVERNICVILIVSLLAALLYFHLINQNPELKEFFIPDKPSMNEYYIHKLRDCPEKVNPNVKFFMAIPYGDNLVSKNNLWNMVRGCSLSKDSLPKTYLLDNFYDNIKFNKNHNDDKIYILKKNTHRKQGLQLFRGTKLAVLREYEEGQYKLIQEFIQNPYLVNNRIMVVRLYLVIFRNEKYNFGVHKYGKCLYTSKDFNMDKIEPDRLITDSKLKLGKDFPKNLEDMENYDKKINLELLKKPIVNVLNCYRQFLKKTDDSTPNKSLTFFQLFGVDIILDSDYKPYLLEINKSPDMNNIYDEVDREGKTAVIRDMKEFIDKGNSNFIFV